MNRTVLLIVLFGVSFVCHAQREALIDSLKSINENISRKRLLQVLDEPDSVSFHEFKVRIRKEKYQGVCCFLGCPNSYYKRRKQRHEVTTYHYNDGLFTIKFRDNNRKTKSVHLESSDWNFVMKMLEISNLKESNKKGLIAELKKKGIEFDDTFMSNRIIINHCIILFDNDGKFESVLNYFTEF